MPRGNVRVSITGEAAGLKRATSEAEASLKKLSDKGAHHLGALAKAAGGLAAAYVGIEAAKGAVETTESLAKTTLVLKRNFGLTAEAASTWGAVLKVNNIDQASAIMSFTTLSKAINGGSKSAVAAFKDLGLSQKDLKGQDFGKTLDEVTAALTKMHGGAQRAADAQILMGRGAKVLAPLFRNDGLGFQQQAKWAKEYGVTLDGHALKSSKDLTVATTQLKFAQMGMQILFTEKVIPTVTKVADTVAKFINQMRTGTGAGGRFADQMLAIWQQLQPVRDALKAIGTFLGQHPRLLVAAAGAFVIWKTAAVAASAVAKAKLLATFLGLGPKAAVGGAEAGAAFGNATATATGEKMRRFNWGGLGRFAGPAFALGFVAAAEPIINQITGGGLSGNDMQTPVRRGLFNLKQKYANQPGYGTQYPHLTSHPGGSHGATGGMIAGPRGAGDIVPLWTKPGEVLLTEQMQHALGRGRVMDTVRRYGGRMLGRFAGAASGGVVADAARSAGFRGNALITALAVADAESGFNAGAKNLKYPDHSIGLWQINQLAHHGAYGSDAALMNPYVNARAAFAISSGGRNWSPWSTFTSGAYRAYLGVASALAGSARSGGMAAPGGSLITGRQKGSPFASQGGRFHSGARRRPPLPTYTDKTPHSDFESFYQAALINAQRTPGTGDDLTVLNAWKTYEQRQYDASLRSGNAQGIIQAGQSLDSINQQIDAITNPNGPNGTGGGDQSQIDALNQLNAQLQQMNDLLKQQAADRQKLFNVSQSQYKGLFAGFVDAISGQIGGRAGLGFMTPSTAGSFASY